MNISDLFLKQKAQVTETFEAIFSRCIESVVDGTKRYNSYLPFTLKRVAFTIWDCMIVFPGETF